MRFNYAYIIKKYINNKNKIINSFLKNNNNETEYAAQIIHTIYIYNLISCTLKKRYKKYETGFK